MRKSIPLFSVVASCAVFIAVLAQSTPAQAQHNAISVGPAKIREAVLALAPARAASSSLAKPAESIYRIIEKDLKWMPQFKLLSNRSFIENPRSAGAAPGTFRFQDWTSLQVDYLIKTQLSGGGDQASLEAYVYQPHSAHTMMSKRYQISGSTTVESIGNRVAADIVEAITGTPGIFETKIAMACDRRGAKEIYVMDFDGSNILQVTHHGSTAISPAWSPDGSKIAYTVTAKNRYNIKGWQLREFDFNANTDRLLSDRPGMNSGAAYSPDGKKIAFTTGFFGNPEVVLLEPQGRRFQRLTNDAGEDVDPSWSPDGRELAFVSSRSGRAMVYKMSSSGGSVTRLTQAGSYNASPSWSLQGDKIAFASWFGSHADIFMMTSGGAGIERLTKGEGSNEDPYLSPDGNFVAFSSTRTGRERSIYVMGVDGSNVRRLTLGLGNCSAPKWSRSPRR